MGCQSQAMACIFRSAEYGLVGTVLSCGQYETAYRPALRRLSLRELRHQNENSQRMERGLRALPWSGQRTCRKPNASEHRQSRETGFRARQRYLHSVSFTGPAVEEPF